MKTNEQYLELQAYVDGELESGRRAQVERELAADPEARAVVETFRSLRQMVQNHEQSYLVPASRDFYWSRIRSQIDQAEKSEQRTTRASTPAVGHWLRWFIPAFGAAAVAVSTMVYRGGIGGHGAGESLATDQGSDVSGAMMFRSEAEGVTICWIQ